MNDFYNWEFPGSIPDKRIFLTVSIKLFDLLLQFLYNSDSTASSFKFMQKNCCGRLKIASTYVAYPCLFWLMKVWAMLFVPESIVRYFFASDGVYLKIFIVHYSKFLELFVSSLIFHFKIKTCLWEIMQSITIKALLS